MTATTDPDIMSEDEINATLVGADPEPAPDQDAPFGYKPDGTPRKRPPTRGPDAKKNARSAPKKNSGGAAPRSKQGKDYTSGVSGLLQIAGMALWMTPTTRPDALAVMEHTENIARAAGATAEARPEFASILDKFMSVGPYGLLVGAVMPLALQVMANHDVLPAQLAAHMHVRSKDEVSAQVSAMEAQMTAEVPDQEPT